MLPVIVFTLTYNQSECKISKTTTPKFEEVNNAKMPT